MTLEDYGFLHDMLNEFREETAKLEVQIAENLAYIREAEAHLRAFENKEPEDRKVFSPRKAENLYKEKIDRIKEEKSSCEERFHGLRDRKAAIDRRIEKIETILGQEEKELSSQKEIEENRQSAVLKSIGELIGRIEKNTACMERNPVQAKQDLIITAKSLREAVDKLS